MEATLLLQATQMRTCLDNENPNALAELNATTTCTLLAYCALRGWFLELSPEWQQAAKSKPTELLYAELSVGLPNLIYAARSGRFHQQGLVAAASRWFTYLDFALKRSAALN